MNKITLQWKEFNVPVNRLDSILKNLLSSNYDGLVCRSSDFDVCFVDEASVEDEGTLTSFWESVTEGQFNPSLREIISQSINEASVFGNALILDAAVENVEMGVTQAGKTRAVADYCADVQRYLQSGSLYAAISKIDDMIAQGVPQDLAPFITVERLQAYKQRIEEYLA